MSSASRLGVGADRLGVAGGLGADLVGVAAGRVADVVRPPPRPAGASRWRGRRARRTTGSGSRRARPGRPRARASSSASGCSDSREAGVQPGSLAGELAQPRVDGGLVVAAAAHQRAARAWPGRAPAGRPAPGRSAGAGLPGRRARVAGRGRRGRRRAARPASRRLGAAGLRRPASAAVGGGGGLLGGRDGRGLLARTADPGPSKMDRPWSLMRCGTSSSATSWRTTDRSVVRGRRRPVARPSVSDHPITRHPGPATNEQNGCATGSRSTGAQTPRNRLIAVEVLGAHARGRARRGPPRGPGRARRPCPGGRCGGRRARPGRPRSSG